MLRRDGRLLNSNPNRLSILTAILLRNWSASYSGDGQIMPDAFVIEVEGATVGIVARDGDAYRFYASSRSFYPLDGERFVTPRLAERAAAALQRQKRRATLDDAISGQFVAP
jgi:hypothetical protein